MVFLVLILLAIVMWGCSAPHPTYDILPYAHDLALQWHIDNPRRGILNPCVAEGDTLTLSPRIYDRYTIVSATPSAASTSNYNVYNLDMHLVAFDERSGETFVVWYENFRCPTSCEVEHLYDDWISITLSDEKRAYTLHYDLSTHRYVIKDAQGAR